MLGVDTESEGELEYCFEGLSASSVATNKLDTVFFDLILPEHNQMSNIYIYTYIDIIKSKFKKNTSITIIPHQSYGTKPG